MIYLPRFAKALFVLFVISLVGCGESNTNTPVQTSTSPDTQTSSQSTGRTSEQHKRSPQTSQVFKEGVHYQKVAEPTTNQQGQIVVTEVFWYGCPHCFQVMPMIDNWEPNLPDNVVVELLAAPLSGVWSMHAQIFYTNQILGIVDQTHSATFEAIHVQGNRLSSLAQAQNFYHDNFAIDKDEYAKAFKSFSVNVAMNNAKKQIETWQISSVPTFVIAGAYVVNSQTAGSNSKIFDVIDYLLNNKV